MSLSNKAGEYAQQNQILAESSKLDCVPLCSLAARAMSMPLGQAYSTDWCMKYFCLGPINIHNTSVIR
jgi:hypothetical protein